MKLDCTHTPSEKSVVISQPAIIEQLIENTQLSGTTNSVLSPYWSGYPVDKIPSESSLPPHRLQQIEDDYCSIVGTLNWLAGGSRPDIATITCILSQYLHVAHSYHLQAAKRVVQYLKGTPTKDIRFPVSTILNFMPSSNIPYPPTSLEPSATRAGDHKMPQSQNQTPMKNSNYLNHVQSQDAIFIYSAHFYGHPNINQSLLGALLNLKSLQQMSAPNASNMYVTSYPN